MTVGTSIGPEKLYDKINNIAKMAKYKLQERQFFSILQKQPC